MQVEIRTLQAIALGYSLTPCHNVILCSLSDAVFALATTTDMDRDGGSLSAAGKWRGASVELTDSRCLASISSSRSIEKGSCSVDVGPGGEF